MQTAALPQSTSAGAIRLPGLAGWAVRTGRALERWGRARAARRLTAAPEASTQRLAETAAAQATAERDALYRSAAIPFR
jgi:hypothetical protein